MNSKKRGFELSAAIIAIVIASILAFAGLLMMFGASFMMTFLEEILAQQGQQLPEGGAEATAVLFGVLGFLVIAATSAVITLGALICKRPIKDGVFRERKGIKIALLVLLGIGLLSIIALDYVTFIIFAVPFGLLLTSLLLKADKKVDNQLDNNLDNK